MQSALAKARGAVGTALPITDHERLRAALRDGDVPTLLMVLTHFERDEALLDEFAPYIGSIFDQPKEAPEHLPRQLRERLFQALTGPGTDTAVDPALMQKMLSIDAREPITPQFIPMLMEQMGFEVPEQRSRRPGRTRPSPDFHVLVIGMLADDVRARGISIDTPTDPLHDSAFIAALNAAYDIGARRSYPECAPVTPIYTNAA